MNRQTQQYLSKFSITSTLYKEIIAIPVLHIFLFYSTLNNYSLFVNEMLDNIFNLVIFFTCLCIPLLLLLHI
jgi:hypothetical protein